MNDNFLLPTPLAKELYHEVAKDLPLIDFHNHLSVSDLAKDRQFANITELWVASDPYKHRVMRMCGIPEERITGDASPFEKFKAFCEVYPKLIGTPLYHWTQMELEQVFGISMLPCPENAEILWNRINALLATPAYSARSILNRFEVEYSAPCVSILDDLTVFQDLSGTSPSLRGDDIVLPSRDFLTRLSELTEIDIADMKDLERALDLRLDTFDRVGTRFADHALDNGFAFLVDDGRNSARFERILRGESLEQADALALSSAILVLLGRLYAKRDWTLQLHIGAQRSTSSRLRALAGAAGGFAAIGHGTDISALTSLLDSIEKSDEGLPRIILFSLNPADNAAMAVLAGSYSKDNVAGLIVQGPAWWWCDHLNGMYEVFESTASYGLLYNFVGMTTDSRSILSFVRHDYYRRALCNWIASKAEVGIFPHDRNILDPLVYALCYGNAKARIL